MASKRNHYSETSDKRLQPDPHPQGELILPTSTPVGEPALDEQTAANDLLRQCCTQFLANFEQYVNATLSLLLFALDAGKYAVLMKGIVGHGNFQTFCERQFPMIKFRRIEQFMTLAESREELLNLLRAEKAQRAALLTDDQLLAETSIRKAQRLLSEPIDDTTTKKKTKKRGRSSTRTAVLGITDDVLTPSFIVDAAISLLGQIDLDPCASECRPNHLRAKSNWTATQDGLARTSHWDGRALVNPPLSAVAAWIEKARHEFQHQRLSEALLLVQAQTDAPWFPMLAEYPRAFFRERLSFPNADDGTATKALAPYAVIYMGPPERTAAFAAAFAHWADAFVPLTVPPNTSPIETQPD